MGEEPSLGELGRRLDQIYGAVRDLIGRAEYAEFQRALEHRLTEMSRDLEDMRREHNSDIKDVHNRITEEAKTAAERGHWRTTLATALLPSLIAVAAILVTILLHGKG